MNANSTTIVADMLMKGALDVLDAILSTDFSSTAQPPKPLTDDALHDYLVEHPIVLHARLKEDAGAVALLLRAADAARLAAMLGDSPGGEASETLDEPGAQALLEIVDPVLGGGVSALMQRFGMDVVQLDQAGMRQDGPDAAPALLDLFSAPALASLVAYSAAPDFTGEAVLVHSQSLEDLAPDRDADADFASQAALSPEEMGDILSGFDAGDESESAESAAPPRPAHAVSSDNLDMVLDIRLLATARLGRVEMPLAEVLRLGPGSIIEVGRMVDEPVELFINDKLVARGDVVVVDERFGLRITEIVSPRERIESLR